VASGTVAAVLVCVVAGLAGAIQAAVMGRFGERIGVVEAVAFASVVTALVAFATVLAVRQTLSGVAEGLRAPPWMWIAGVMSAFIVFAVALARVVHHLVPCPMRTVPAVGRAAGRAAGR